MSRVIHWLPCLVVMVIIFMFSHQPADESSLHHSRVIRWLMLVGIDVVGWFGQDAVFWVRKTAHFIIYGVLGLSYLWAFHKERYRYPIGMAWIASLFYAMSDEFHQKFVEGRGASLADVGIDMLGTSIFLILFYLLNPYFSVDNFFNEN